ncbi:hypothetical protein [Streptomyces sp. SGAir0957]
MPTPVAVTAVVDVDEERVSHAHAELIRLGAALVCTPFDPQVHERLRALLHDNDLAPVLDSLEALRSRPEARMRQRLAELCGHSLRMGEAA